MIAYPDEDRPAPAAASAEADYALYAAGAQSPIVTVHLVRGEPLGFRPESDALIAVAGLREVRLDPSEHYYWKRL